MESRHLEYQSLRKEVAEMKAAFRAELDTLRQKVELLESQVENHPVARPQDLGQPVLQQPVAETVSPYRFYLAKHIAFRNTQVESEHIAIRNAQVEPDPEDSSDSLTSLKKRVLKAQFKDKVPVQVEYPVTVFLKKYGKK